MGDNLAEQKVCLSCEANATIVCFDCKNYYCVNCFNSIHKSPKMKIHKKDEITPALPIEIKCLNHQDYQITSFCLNDKGK